MKDRERKREREREKRKYGIIKEKKRTSVNRKKESSHKKM
jgi:hypothetical protein